ncbi:YraN family protein [Lentzea sp. HUAS12]|uniref:YraN family protein n=1 Tax=Lentzea sp. HUAS12 TaxID=2951806 RepID=UPI0020A0D264|nr:YraN family protein [Lentzea sp. HUAS12]USX51520.1 YraN family protein [Lentzea sp. HUAS12]
MVARAQSLVETRQQEKGRQGEELACRYLEGLGLVVLSRNWTCRDGELDIVAVEGDRLVVCEVKTRSGAAWGRPDEAVDQRKLSRLRRTALRWLAAHGVGWCSVRVDLISITWPPSGEPRLEHLRGA